MPGVNPTFDLSAAASADKGEDSEVTKKSHRVDSLESGFVRALTEEGPDGSCESLSKSIPLLYTLPPSFLSYIANIPLLADDPLFTLIKTLSPPALDAELRSMTAPAHQARLLRALTQRLRARRDFEAVQAVMGVVLKVWGESLVGSATPASWSVRAPLDGGGSGPMNVDDDAEELRDALAELREVQAKESERVLGLVAASLGTLGFIRETL